MFWLALKKNIRRLAVLLVLVVFSTNTVALALTPEQKRLIDSGVREFNIEADAECNTTGSGSSSGSVYMLGDSITVRSTPALQTAFQTNNQPLQKINAAVGRSITAPGEGTETGLQVLLSDASDIAASGSVVIALGTNPSGANEDGVRQVFNAVRASNPSARIFWVNIFSPAAINRESFNQTLVTLSSSLGFTVINTNSAGIEMVSDDIHPSTNGSATFAQTVAAGLSGGSSVVSATGCACSLGGSLGGSLDRNTRYQATWAYFIEKGLSPEATAGLMGNLEAESGIDPQNTQNNAPAPDGPEIPIDAIRGRFGYGIAQWTSAGRQDNLIAFARQTNRSTGDLGLQLDFLWKELSESYTGVLTVLQTPDVSLAESSAEVLLRFEIPASVLGGAAERQATILARQRLGEAIFNEFSGQTISSSTGAGCNTSGVAIDLTDTDTTDIVCGAGTVDSGNAQGYRDGQVIQIRLCQVGGTRINSQLAGSIARMLSDASSAGVALGINGGFRDMQGQIDIYNSWCGRAGITPTPPPYPKTQRSDYQSCPGGAPPGYSNHQQGLAVDLECNGQLIAQSYTSAQNNPCFQWLVANASKYGLYEFGKGQDRTRTGYEAWHWSVDGN